uniref:Uncharacterized protein n=1 Tax=Arundo donax TaxID=35708 RepID=A0A0A8YP32_ARUDO
MHQSSAQYDRAYQQHMKYAQYLAPDHTALSCT